MLFKWEKLTSLALAEQWPDVAVLIRGGDVEFNQDVILVLIRDVGSNLAVN